MNIVVVAVIAALQAPAAPTPSPPDRDYLAFVASEATDRIALVRFGPAGARVEREWTIGLLPTDPDGPHGLAVSPDGRHLFVSTAHGEPFGYLWKLEAATGRTVGRVELGNFPATLQLTPDGVFAYVVNFNLHGDMVPSSVSIVATEEMVEVARIPTCTMPHGSRINAQGTRQYSACMMDDLVVEIDARTLAVARSFRVAPGAAGGFAGLPPVAASHAEHPTPGARHLAPVCSPTWVQPSADGARVYVACNKANEIVEIATDAWTITRRLPAAEGVYNLAVTRDGRLLVATNKRARSVSLFDVGSGKEVARLATRRRIVHGVVVTPDDRYAFVSVEGVGSEPGTVEVVDLRAHTVVAAVDVGQMAGGIDFWKTEPVTR